MKDIKVSEVKEMKIILEQNIKELIEKFEKETDLAVEEVILEALGIETAGAGNLNGNRPILGSVHAVVTIP